MVSSSVECNLVNWAVDAAAIVIADVEVTLELPTL